MGEVDRFELDKSLDKDKGSAESMQGKHAKSYSLLSDPTVAAELRAYVRSK